MSLTATVNIAAFTPYPCCSWKLTKQHDCGNPIARHYKNGLLEVKFSSPVTVIRDSSSFNITDGNSWFYINYNEDIISIDGVELDKDVITEDAFEAYLQGLFCCTETVSHLYVLEGLEHSPAECRESLSNFSASITNKTPLTPIPAGTIFNLEWTNLGDNPTFSTSIDSPAEISNDGTTLELLADLMPGDLIIFSVEFDNPECLSEIECSVEITAGDGFNIYPINVTILAGTYEE